MFDRALRQCLLTFIVDLKDGSSCKPIEYAFIGILIIYLLLATGLQACTYEVKVQGIEDEAEVWVEAPHTESFGTDADRQWELVEMRGVSEGGTS